MLRFRILEESTSSDYCGRNESNMSLIATPNSGSTYYFRRKIPTDLIEHFGGLKEFRISLKCAIKSRSIRTTIILNQKVSGIFEDIRQGMKSLEIEDIKEILRVEIRKQILHAHHVDLGTNKWSDSGVEKSLDTTEKKDLNLRETLKNDLKSYLKQVDSKMEGILESMNIKIEKESVGYKRLREHFIDLYLMRYEWIKELVLKTGKSDDDFRKDFDSKFRLDLFPELSNSVGLTESLMKDEPNNNSTTSDELPYLPIAGGLLSSNIKTFIDRKKVEGKSIKEIGSDNKILEEFVEIVGDFDFSRVTKKEVSYYIDVQTKLPPNRKKSQKYRDLTIKQVMELNLSQKETQTPQNINKRLSKLSVFGNWGVRQGLLLTNPFSGMKFLVKKQPNRRQPFTTDDLKKILKPETYLNWTINFEHPYKIHKVNNKLPYYWVFLLGIFSGMRTNEMCQLRLSDLKKVDKIWFMFVEDSENTKVKTESSIRKIPLHPQLIELGFIDYVGNLRKKKKTRVFWELREDRDGFASKVSRHYNEKFLPAIGVWEKHKKVLYCTRHTFINKLYSEKVDENVIKTLVGHEKEFTMKHYGGDPFTPEVLLEEISKVNYSIINWKGLKT
ncbi:MAG TPA: site-specific integrase [Nitrosopumilus sp.]|nr:site-specific integrase [Nitrosopumilus sp.]